MTDNNQVPDPMTVRHSAEKLGLNPIYFSNLHKRSLARVYDAYNDKAPELLAKMWRRILYLESKQLVNS